MAIATAHLGELQASSSIASAPSALSSVRNEQEWLRYTHTKGVGTEGVCKPVDNCVEGRRKQREERYSQFSPYQLAFRHLLSKPMSRRVPYPCLSEASTAM